MDNKKLRSILWMFLLFSVLTMLCHEVGLAQPRRPGRPGINSDRTGGGKSDKNFPDTSNMTKNYLDTNNVKNFGYWLYAPKAPQDNMPLIVYLHGGRSKGSDLNLLIDGSGFPKYVYEGQIKDIPAYIIFPQCPSDGMWERVAPSVKELIDEIVKTKNIDTKRISLTGHSMGGSGTWFLGAKYNDVFSSVAPLSGGVRQNNANRFVNVAVWAFVGDADTIVNPSSSIDMVDQINAAGGNAKITSFNGASHFNVPDLTYLDSNINLINWMISKSKTGK